MTTRTGCVAVAAAEASPVDGRSAQIVLATHNPHKVEEFQAIVAAARARPRGRSATTAPSRSRTASTFAENALIKARAAAAHTGLPALADDSGICVDVLGGAPGVFSAYWAGHAKDAAANLNLLLDQLSDIRDPHRTAQFVSTIALVVPGDASSRAASSRASGPGGSRPRPRATGGFGYDPIFIPDGQPPAPSGRSGSGRAARRTRLAPRPRVRGARAAARRRSDASSRRACARELRIRLIPD